MSLTRKKIEAEGAPLSQIDIKNYPPKQRVLAAALKLFVEQGYFKTNVPDLSRESKCSVGSIYHNFKNKEEIAIALYDEGINAFRRTLESALAEVDDIETQIKTLIHAFLMFSEVNHQLSRYLWLSRHAEFVTGNLKHPTMIGFDSLGRKLTRSIKVAIRNKNIKPMRAHVIWSIIFGIPLSYVRDWFDGYNPLPPSEVSDALADACWRALREN